MFTATSAQILGTTTATSTNTGALQVVGGVGIGGDVYIGGILNATVVGSISTATNLSGGTTGQIPYQTNTGLTNFFGPGTAGQVLVSNGNSAPSYQNNLTLTLLTATTFTISGSSTLANLTATVFTATSANIIGNETVGGTLSVSNTTSAISTNSGALQVAGGAGIGGNLYVGGTTVITGDLYVDGTSFVVDKTTLSSGDLVLALGTSTANAAAATNGGIKIGTTATPWISLLFDGGTGWQANWTSSGGLKATTFNNINITNPGAGNSSTITISSGKTISFSQSLTFPSSAGTTGYVLVTDGAGTLSWSSPSTISAGTATNANNVATIAQTGNANYYPTFVNANNVSSAYMAEYTTSSFTINPSTGVVNINSAVPTSSTTTGALQVVGGVGIGGGLYVGGIITATNMVLNGYQVSTSSALTIQLAGVGQGVANTLNLATGTTVSVSGGIATIQAVQTLQQVTNQGSSSTNAINITNVTASTSTTTGALQVVGGVGIGGNLTVGGTITATNVIVNGYSLSTATTFTGGTIANALIINNTASSTSTTTGALQVVGGVGVGGSIYAGGTVTASSFITTGTNNNNISGVNNITAVTAVITSTATSTSTVTGALIVTGGVGIGGNLTVGSAVNIPSNTAANSTNTGALIVTGGVGIGGNAYVKGNVYTNGTQIIPTAIQEFTATANTTTFTISGGYTVGTVQVFANGIQLSSSDYTASNGTTIVLNTPRAAGDIIRTVAGVTSTTINNIQAFSIAMSVALG